MKRILIVTLATLMAVSFANAGITGKVREDATKKIEDLKKEGNGTVSKEAETKLLDQMAADMAKDGMKLETARKGLEFVFDKVENSLIEKLAFQKALGEAKQSVDPLVKKAAESAELLIWALSSDIPNHVDAKTDVSYKYKDAIADVLLNYSTLISSEMGIEASGKYNEQLRSMAYLTHADSVKKSAEGSADKKPMSADLVVTISVARAFKAELGIKAEAKIRNLQELEATGKMKEIQDLVAKFRKACGKKA